MRDAEGGVDIGVSRFSTRQLPKEFADCDLTGLSSNISPSGRWAVDEKILNDLRTAKAGEATDRCHIFVNVDCYWEIYFVVHC